MPPRNPPRSLGSEENLARRVAYERDRMGLTYAALAQRMTDAGVPMHATAIYKIENGDPPARPTRRITVDELIGFSVVFDTPVQDLLLPVKDAVYRAWDEVVEELRQARDEADRARAAADHAREEAKRATDAYFKTKARVDARLAKLGLGVSGVQSGVAEDGLSWMIASYDHLEEGPDDGEHREEG